MENIQFKRVHRSPETGAMYITYWGFLREGNRNFVSPTTITNNEVIVDCQLTPVKTPDGKDIYEGDIVEHSNEIPFGGYDDGLVGEVKMLEAQWVIDTGKELIPLWMMATHRTVLGNKFDNT